MKTALIFRLSILLVLLSVSMRSQAQASAPALASAPQSGYWNLETNLTTRDYTTVRFYTADDELLYTETLPNLCLDLSRGNRLCRHTKSQLNATLQRVMLDPAAATRQGDLLAAQFSADRHVQRVYATR